MKISARNQLKGKIAAISEGAVNSILTLDINGTQIKSTITRDAVKELGLAVGKEAYAIIKATEVMISPGTPTISARNRLAGKITAVDKGAVNAVVTLDIGGGNAIKSTISLEAVNELGLKAGDPATAVIKATSVMLGVDG